MTETLAFIVIAVSLPVPPSILIGGGIALAVIIIVAALLILRNNGKSKGAKAGPSQGGTGWQPQQQGQQDPLGQAGWNQPGMGNPSENQWAQPQPGAWNAQQQPQQPAWGAQNPAQQPAANAWGQPSQPPQQADQWGQPAAQQWPTAYGGNSAAPQWGQPAPSAPVDPWAASTAQSPAPGQPEWGQPAQPTQAVTNDKTAHPARLVLRSESGAVLQEYPLEKPDISIGRAPNSDISLTKDKLTSRRHATVYYENGQYILRDERSANGTFVNGQQLEEMSPRILQDGDHVGIGEHELTFHTSPVESAVEDMPTVAVKYDAASSEFTSRTREDDNYAFEEVGVPVQNDFGTRSMDSGMAAPFAQDTQAQSAPMPGRVPKPPVHYSMSILPEPVLQAPAPTSASVFRSTTPVYSPEQLRFTAFHPKEIAVESWNTLLVYAHIEPVVEAVYKDAQRFKAELGDAPRKTSVPATQLLLRQTNITIVPECKGVVFNPKRFTFKWLEDWHRASFRFSAKPELVGSAGNGRINIFAGPLLVGTLKLALLFEEQDTMLAAKDRNIQETANLYKQIFASYSHDDSLIVLTCRDVFKTLGYNTLIDIDTLRSGQKFSDALKRMIDAADIFQLFWSERSAKSTYVTEEWEYALRLNRGEGFVRPVYWEVPMAKPPEKLAPLHFAYLPAYTFAQQQQPLSGQKPLDRGSMDSPFIK